MFATFYLTELRKDELAHLTWNDLDFKRATLGLTAKEGFTPKDYVERGVPMPQDLVAILKKLPHLNVGLPQREGKTSWTE